MAEVPAQLCLSALPLKAETRLVSQFALSCFCGEIYNDSVAVRANSGPRHHDTSLRYKM